MSPSLILTILFLVLVTLSVFGVIAMAWPNVCIAYLAALAVIGSIPIQRA